MRKLLVIFLLFSGCSVIPASTPTVIPAEKDSLIINYNGMRVYSRPFSSGFRLLCVKDSDKKDTLATVPYLKGSLRLKWAMNGWTVLTLTGSDLTPKEVYVSRFDSLEEFEIEKPDEK